MTQKGTRVWPWVAAVVLLAAAGCSTPCDELREEAHALLADYAQCDKDADCMITSVNAPCLDPFLCSEAVRKDADLKRLRKEAEALSRTYREECMGACSQATCIHPDMLSAVCVNHQCAPKYSP